MKRSIILVLALCLLIPTVAFAMDDLIMATGHPKQTYSAMFKNLKGVCPAVTEFTETTGGFDNVSLLTTQKVDLGIIPEDVLELSKQTDTGLDKKIRALVGLHFNSLHIIVLKNGSPVKSGSLLGKISSIGSGGERKVIQELRDLKGLRVACFGSGIVTGNMINQRLQLALELVDVPHIQEAMKMLQNGEVFAVFATAGWPIEWVANLDPAIFTLASVDDSSIQKLGAIYKPVKLNYKKLQVFGIVTCASRNVIACRNYTSKARIEQLMAFKQCLLDNLQDIKEMRGSHPSWNDVEADEEIIWPMYDGLPTPAAKPAKK